jgi:MtrB/PioB family decaheme-associated outer membrane protein
MTHTHCMKVKLAPLAAALALAFGTAQAQQSDEVQALITPESHFSIGALTTSNNGRDAIRAGQYTDLNQNINPAVEIDWNRRDEASGIWTNLQGRNLGLETQELGFSQEKQGDWRYGIDYNEIVRNDPYLINTGMLGIGGSNPTIRLIALPAGAASGNAYLASNGVAGHNEELKLHRTGLGLSGDKWFNSELQLEVNLKVEEKKGARMFGRVGMDSGDMKFRPTNNTVAGGNGAILLTPEPIDSSIRTIEAKLNFNRGKLALTGGYYGSFYVNNVAGLNVNVPGALNRGGLWTGGVTALGCANLTGSCSVQQLASATVALPPDNQAHQIFFSGTHAYSDLTRVNFKLSFTQALQQEDFGAQGLVAAGTAPTNLEGNVETTLAQLGVTSRPIKDLTVNASLRYEDRVDKTSVRVYNLGSANAVLNTTNWPSGSETRSTAKVDGIYRLSGGYSANGGMDWERKVMPLPPARTGVYGTGGQIFRSATDETGIHGGLRKALSETLNGGLELEYKTRRSGDAWVSTSNTSANPVIKIDQLANSVFPDLYLDRDRVKARGSVDWEATERLSVQTVLEHSQDEYKRDWRPIAQTVNVIPGARVMTNESATVDTTFRLTDDWKVNGYWTHSESRWKVNKVNIGDDTRNLTDTVGLGIAGKVNGKLSVGADYLLTKDTTGFSNLVGTVGTGDANGNIIGANGTRSPGGNALPDINYDTIKLNLFALYEVDKQASVKANLIYQEFKNNDWQWGYNGVPFLYSDNTTVSNPNQSVTFLGLAYIRKF